MPKKPFASKPEEKKKALLEALKKSNGIIYKACDRVGVSRQLYYIYTKEDKSFKDEAESIIQRQIDIVEEKMLSRIEDGSDKLIEFYMSTKGKHRGYKRTQEVEVQEKKKVIIVKRASESDEGE